MNVHTLLGFHGFVLVLRINYNIIIFTNFKAVSVFFVVATYT